MTKVTCFGLLLFLVLLEHNYELYVGVHTLLMTDDD